MKIFEIDEVHWEAAESHEVHWVAAESREFAKSYYALFFGVADLSEVKVRELTDPELDTLVHSGDEDDPNRVNLTFRKRLEQYVASGEVFPMLFASTD